MRKVAGQIPENSDSLVRAVVATVTAESVTTMEHVVGRGFNNAVTVAHTSVGRFVVRTNVASHLFRYEREAWCLKQLGNRDVPVPDVLGCGLEEEHAYSIARFVEGSSAGTSAREPLRVWSTLGRYASTLNSIGESELAACERADEYFPDRWEQQVAEDVRIIFHDGFWVANGELTPGEEDRLRRYLLESAALPHPKGVCQFDLSIDNALILDDECRHICLVDLEFANIAPAPLYQLACIAASHGPESEITRAFFAGYGVSFDDLDGLGPDFDRLLLLRVMRGTAWARDRAPKLLAENRRRTRPILRKILT